VPFLSHLSIVTVPRLLSQRQDLILGQLSNDQLWDCRLHVVQSGIDAQSVTQHVGRVLHGGAVCRGSPHDQDGFSKRSCLQLLGCSQYHATKVARMGDVVVYQARGLLSNRYVRRYAVQEFGTSLIKQLLLNGALPWAAAGFMDTLLRWKMKPEVVYGNEKAIQPGVQA
jgi:hypothetical protein